MKTYQYTRRVSGITFIGYT